MSDAPAQSSFPDFAGVTSASSALESAKDASRIRSVHLGLFLGFCETLIVCLSAFASAWIYHASAIEEAFRWELYLLASLALGLAFSVCSAMRGQYALGKIDTPDTSVVSAFYLFNIVFAIFVCMLFISKLTDIYSRASLALQYFAACGSLVVGRAILAHGVGVAVRRGRVEARRIALIGAPRAIEDFLGKHSDGGRDASVLTSVELPDWASDPLRDSHAAELDLIAGQITTVLRSAAVDDIVILLPWSAAQSVEILAKRLTALPATIQLLPNTALSWFRAPAVIRIGTDVGLSLSRPPLTAFDRAAKRALDVFLASMILIAVAPLMVMVAVAIWAESGGPILFRQQRHGFNQKMFKILKFRTMTTLEDGANVVQATRGDSRVTAVGQVLRRSSLDELPQLINVLRGDMSLVGPRPHALAHTLEYEKKIAFYAHRHNVKPGLTGWAQVNGYRGETNAPWKMEKRVEHDLYYIDNWSLMLDFKILAMTVLSENTFKNAC